MAKVLIAEDELIYREYLAAALDAEGHEVACTTNGKDAIKTGSLFRPDILVTDWMLKSNVHGLHVSRVLRQINPGQKTILITGFSSSDVMLDASKDEIFALIHKPFELGEFKEKVFEASLVDSTRSFNSELGFIEIDGQNKITFCNSYAAKLLGEEETDLPKGNIGKFIFCPGDSDNCRNSGKWFSAGIRNTKKETLQIFSLKFSDKEGYFLIVIDSTQKLLMKSKMVELLVDAYSNSPEPNPWPFSGRVLLIDENVNFRRVTIDLFDSAGVLCHGASSFEQALAIIERDLGLRYVTLNCESSNTTSFLEECRQFVRFVKGKIPEVTLIGFSSQDRSEEMKKFDIPLFIKEPWSIEQLIDLIKAEHL